MTVYIDSFVIYNYLINYLILSVTKSLYNSKTTKFKMIFGSVLCVFYSAMIFIKNNSFIFTYPCKIIFSLIVIAIVYKHNSFVDYIRTVAVFYIVTFVFGGTVYALINNRDFKLMFIATVCAYALLSLFSMFYKRASVQKNSFVDLQITCGCDVVNLRGLNDTGNSLFDPYTKLPVIIAAAKYFADINKPLRLIPFKSVGVSDGLIPAFTPDKVMLNGKETKFVIGIYNEKLSYDGSFDALVNTEGSVI